MRILAVVVAGFLSICAAGAEDWQVVWKDSSQTLKVDRDSVRVNGSQVEYWYSDEVDALVDWMEHRYYAISDCGNNRILLVRMYDPATGQTRELEGEWKDATYDPDDPIKVMHEEVCRSYAPR